MENILLQTEIKFWRTKWICFLQITPKFQPNRKKAPPLGHFSPCWIVFPWISRCCVFTSSLSSPLSLIQGSVLCFYPRCPNGTNRLLFYIHVSLVIAFLKSCLILPILTFRSRFICAFNWNVILFIHEIISVVFFFSNNTIEVPENYAIHDSGIFLSSQRLILSPITSLVTVKNLYPW